MFRQPPTIDSIRQDVHSADQETRGRAMQALYFLAKKEPGMRATALPIFRELLTTAPDGWTATNAARGIELVAGESEGRAAWATLLASRKVAVVTHAVLLTVDAAFAPTLLTLLSRRKETPVRSAAIRALGRMKGALPYDVIVKFLDDPVLRPDAVQALGDLGDARALPLLVPCLRDESKSGVVDDRGVELRISDLAQEALNNIRRAALR